MKSVVSFLFRIAFCLVLGAGVLPAQSPCSHIDFTLVNYQPCCYRLVITNTSECYQNLRLLLSEGEFSGWNASNGWTATGNNPSELMLTHNSGHIPTGASTPTTFCLPSGVAPVLTLLWDAACPPGEGCFAEYQLESCIIVPDACIQGVNYVDVGCSHLPYSNQPVLSGWTIFLLDNMGNTLDSTTTAANGAYSFCDLPPGNYVVKKANKPNWISGVPASGQYAVSLSQSETETRNFGSCRVNCQCNTVQTTVQQISSSPTACCYGLSTLVSGGGDFCFQYIDVQVDAGQFITPSSAQTGWIVTQNGPQALRIIPPGGFIPGGSASPVTFCVSGSTTHDIFVSTGFNDSAGAHDCEQILTFSCPDCTCPPPTELTVTDVESTSAVVHWVPAACTESTWVYVEDGLNAVDHISRPVPVDSIVLDSLVPGRTYFLYAFSMCNGAMSGPSDTVVFYIPCEGLCPQNLVSNGGFDAPYTFFPTVPNAVDQIGLSPGWQAATNGSASGIGEWFMSGSPFYIPTPFPGSYYNSTNNQYTLLEPHCSFWYAGFDLHTCEGIRTQLTAPIQVGNGYDFGFWWALKEPVTTPFSFLAILSNGACTMNTANGGTACSHQCGGDFHVPVNVTTAHQPGIWYFHHVAANAPMTANYLTFTANSSGPGLNNYIYLDDICLRKVLQICDVGKPRIFHNPEQPNAFLGEANLGAGSSLVSAVWDFGDGTRDSSCCLGSVIHDFLPGIYEVCLTVTAVDTSGETCSNSACINIDIEESGDPCDDIAAFLQASGQGECCFNLNINNTAANFFTGIDVTLSSGNYINSQLGPNWNANLNGSMISLTPSSSGFISQGQDVPLVICDPGGTNPYTVDVDFVHAGGVCHESLSLNCDPASCTCQGFQNLVFYNFLNLPDMPVGCDNQPSLQLPCIGSDAIYFFQGNLLCQGNCIPTINYEIFPVSGPSVLSGSINGNYFFTGGFKFPPGDYHIVLTGDCGGNTCTCTVNFTIPNCGSCCSDNQADFSQTVANAVSFATNTATCEATFQIGPLPCQRIAWVNWGDGSAVSVGPFFPGAGPVHTYAHGGIYTVTYRAEEIHPISGALCFDEFFSQNIAVDCGCCSPDQNTFSQTVANAITITQDAANCKATVQIGSLPCQQVDWVNWGDGNQSTGPFYSGAMPMHTYTQSGPFTITYSVKEIYPVISLTCYEEVFSHTIVMDCDCSCGTYTMEYRPGGAQNQPVSCGETIQLGLDQAFALYPEFVCQGPFCALFVLVNWALAGPGGLSVSSSDLATPNFTVSALSPGSFSTPGLYTLTMYAICGLQDTCWCELYFNVADPCCTDQTTFLATAAAVQTNGILNDCFIGMQAVGLTDCMQITYDWGDNQSTGPISTDNTPVTHTYAGPGTYNVCYNIEEKDFFGNICWNYQVCEQVLVLCGGCCGGPNDPDTVSTEITVVTDDLSCSAVLHTGNLPACFYVDSISWGDGVISAGPFGADVSVTHVYETDGTYEVTFALAQSEPGATTPCFVKTYTRSLELSCVIDCSCGAFTNLQMYLYDGNPSLVFNCGTDVILPCVPYKEYHLSGSFACQGLGCNSGVPITWTLTGPQGQVVAPVTTLASPGFDIYLPSGLFSVAGTYTLTMTTTCGLFPCTCVVYFVVTQPCPPLCPCNVADFQADVMAGFMTLQHVGSCTVCFRPVVVDTCDRVEWSIDNGPYSAPAQTHLWHCSTFFGNGTHTIAMRISRKKGLNLPCETFVFQKTITVNCDPLPDCSTTKIFNPGFDSMAVAGVLGAGGLSAHWSSAGGSPRVDSIAGSSDGWVVTLAGNNTDFDGLRTSEPICLEKDSGTIRMLLRPVDANGTPTLPKPGERIVVQLVRNDNFLPASCDLPDCIGIASVEIPGNLENWAYLEFNFDLTGVSETDDCDTSMPSVLVYPIVYVTNALDGGQADKSHIQIDHFCLQLRDEPVGTLAPAGKTRIRIFPNPNPGTFSVELPEPAQEGMRFRIVGLTGQALREQTIPAGGKLQTVQTGDLPGGLYFLQVVSEGKVVAMEKFVKQ